MRSKFFSMLERNKMEQKLFIDRKHQTFRLQHIILLKLRLVNQQKKGKYNSFIKLVTQSLIMIDYVKYDS